MPQKLNRRRFAEVVKFLKATVGDERIAHKVRMRAAERLIEVYAQNEKATKRSEARGAKARDNQTPGPQQGQGEAATAQESTLGDSEDKIKEAFEFAMQVGSHE